MDRTMKKHGSLLLVCLLAIACAVMGIAGIGATTASAESEQAAANSKIFYYVDAGNYVENPDGTGKNVIRGTIGYPSVQPNIFMQQYGLAFGTGTDGVYAAGLYNSVTDKESGVDTVTGKEWGYVTYDYHNDWRVGVIDSAAAGYNTYREINENNDGTEGVLTYKFEVDDTTTPLKVEFGTRTPSGWGAKPYKMKVNGGAENEITSDETNRKYAFDAVGVNENGKNFITLEFSTDGMCALVNYIMITTADYQLPDLVTYDFSKFAVKGSTTLKALSSENAQVEATLDQTAQNKINGANAFDIVAVNATIEGTPYQNLNVTVLPAATQYFVNMGEVGDGFILLQDGAYSVDKGFGYTGVQGTEGWQGASYDQSCVYGSNNVPFTYQFDLDVGSYGVIVGTAGHWDMNREMLVSINGGAKQTLNATASQSSRGTYYGDVTEEISGGKGALNLTVEHAENDNYIVTFLLVYKVNKITYDVNGGDRPIKEAEYFDLGTSAILTTEIPKRPGYSFDGWYTAETGGTKVEAGESLTSSQTLYAHWTAKTYSVSFIDDASDDTQGTLSITSGTAITADMLPAAPAEREGYTYGWYTTTNVSTRVQITVGTVWAFDYEELYGIYTANEYTVTLVLGAGSLADGAEDTITVTFDGTFELPEAVPAEGYLFDGWYTAEEGGAKVESGTWTTADDVSLYARYSQVTHEVAYEVTFEVNGGSEIAPISVAQGETVTAPANPTRAGHTFAGWYADEGLSAAFDFGTILTGDITLYAKWTVNAYTVTFHVGGGSEIAPATVNHGDKTAQPANPTREGFTFKGWYLDEACTQAFDFDTQITANTALYAAWEEDAAPKQNYTWVIVVSVVGGVVLLGGAGFLIWRKKFKK